MKKGVVIVNWTKIYSPFENGGLKINNLRHKNNDYLLKLTWNFAYINKPWSLILKARVLKSKYQFKLAYKYSSIWPVIKQFYDTILEHTSWTVGTGIVINFWNDKRCSLI